MNNDCTQKKTLMNSLEKLNTKANMLENSLLMSERLIDKLMRTDDSKKPISDVPMTLSSSQQDIIDLFDNVDIRFERALIQLDNNIDRVIGMID